MSAFQPASWRGVPFGVREAQVRLGRRCAVHEYPQRETVWVEDLGRSARRLRFIGFLMEHSALYAGGDLAAQQQRLLAAVEAPGEGELVHPALGRLSVSCTEAVVAQRWNQQRVVEIAFEFIESGQPASPSAALDTREAVSALAAAADQAAAGDFIALADEAGSLYRCVHDLPGTFGGYFKGRVHRLEAVTQGVQPDLSDVQKISAL